MSLTNPEYVMAFNFKIKIFCPCKMFLWLLWPACKKCLAMGYLLLEGPKGEPLFRQPVSQSLFGLSFINTTTFTLQSL